MTATSWDQLPLRVRREVGTHVDRCIGTFRTQELEDVIRWTVDGLLASRSFEHAPSYMEGYEDAHQGGAPRLRTA